MGMLDFFIDKAVGEARAEDTKELKRLKALEQRTMGMLQKYTDLYQRGRNKAMVINVINDLDKVLGVKPDGK